MDKNASMVLFFVMNSEDFASLNVPASVFSILVNFFFVYCKVFRQHKQEQLKQPLNVLQGILVGCNIVISICTLLKVCMNVYPSRWAYFPIVVSQCMVYTMMTSVTSSFWQNVFYYCQITPKQSYFIWLKKSLRVFIYCALLINMMVYLFGLSLIPAIIVILNNYANNNDTSADSVINSPLANIVTMWYSVSSVTLCLLILNLCGMSTSSYATVIYLWKHLKNMEQSSSLSSPRFQRQIWMTIRSIALHALLHFICSMGVIVVSSLCMYSELNCDLNGNTLCTFISFYALGTTISLGIAQSLFRQQIACVWKKMFPIF